MKNNIIFKFIRSSWDELKKVKWPTRVEVVNHTIVVVISIVIATAIVAALDYGLSYLIQYLVQNSK